MRESLLYVGESGDPISGPSGPGFTVEGGAVPDRASWPVNGAPTLLGRGQA